jgi:hypothetical protein
MIGKRLFLLLFFFVFILSNSVLITEEYPVVGSKIKICILAYDTEFKKNIIKALVKDFNAKETSVTVDDVSNRSRYRAVDYDAVILLSGLHMLNPLPEAVDFLRKNKYSSNIIYVITHGKKFKVPKNRKIDIITSASIINDEKAFDETKNKIIDKVMKVVNK